MSRRGQDEVVSSDRHDKFTGLQQFQNKFLTCVEELRLKRRLLKTTEDDIKNLKAQNANLQLARDLAKAELHKEIEKRKELIEKVHRESFEAISRIRLESEQNRRIAEVIEKEKESLLNQATLMQVENVRLHKALQEMQAKCEQLSGLKEAAMKDVAQYNQNKTAITREADELRAAQKRLEAAAAKVMRDKSIVQDNYWTTERSLAKMKSERDMFCRDLIHVKAELQQVLEPSESQQIKATQENATLHMQMLLTKQREEIAGLRKQLTAESTSRKRLFETLIASNQAAVNFAAQMSQEEPDLPKRREDEQDPKPPEVSEEKRNEEDLAV